jgi:hypothetical protein
VVFGCRKGLGYFVFFIEKVASSKLVLSLLICMEYKSVWL